MEIFEQIVEFLVNDGYWDMFEWDCEEVLLKSLSENSSAFSMREFKPGTQTRLLLNRTQQFFESDEFWNTNPVKICIPQLDML